MPELAADASGCSTRRASTAAHVYGSRWAGWSPRRSPCASPSACAGWSSAARRPAARRRPGRRCASWARSAWAPRAPPACRAARGWRGCCSRRSSAASSPSGRRSCCASSAATGRGRRASPRTCWPTIYHDTRLAAGPHPGADARRPRRQGPDGAALERPAARPRDPRRRARIVDGAGHAYPLEQPERSRDLLVDWSSAGRRSRPGGRATARRVRRSRSRGRSGCRSARCGPASAWLHAPPGARQRPSHLAIRLPVEGQSDVAARHLHAFA